MKRAMLFIDNQNFYYACRTLYASHAESTPYLDYLKLRDAVQDVLHEEDVDIVKTMMFISKPDSDLMYLDRYRKPYDFYSRLNFLPNLSVIEGSLRLQPAEGVLREDIKLDDHSTFVVNEKGTDVNIAMHLLVKAFNNSYDMAVVLSGDTDYIPVYQYLDTIGKTVVVVGVGDQSLKPFTRVVDYTATLDKYIIDKCISDDRTD